jgi:hypothetical protein
MREFAKSALSFSWALSLLGINNAVNMLRPERPKNADAFAPVTEVAVNQLDETIRGVYRYGDNIQARVVDTAFSWFNPGQWARMIPTNFMRAECPGQATGNQSQTPPGPAPQQAPGNSQQNNNEADAATGWGAMPAN